MAGSKLVAVRQAVIAGISDLPGFADIETMFAYAATTSAQFAYTRGSTLDHQAPVMRAGRTVRREVGGFELVIWVQLPGKTPEEACQRALDLGLVAEEWIADHRDPAVDGVDWLMVSGSGTLREGAGDQAGVAELVYPLQYSARLD